MTRPIMTLNEALARLRDELPRTDLASGSPRHNARGAVKVLRLLADVEAAARAQRDEAIRLVMLRDNRPTVDELAGMLTVRRNIVVDALRNRGGDDGQSQAG